MALVDRVRNICLSPATEWPVIAAEQSQPAELITLYLLPLAAIGAAAGFVGNTLIGTTIPFVGTYRSSIVGGLVAACLALVMTVIGCFVIAFIINALAPTFGARQDSSQAFKTSVYSYTPGLVAGVLTIIPVLSALTSLIAGVYGLYLLYLGLPVTMKAPREKALAYTIVVVLASIVLMIVIGAVFALLTGGLISRPVL